MTPTKPHREAGTLTDPPVSVPKENTTIPEATATEDPPLEPPEILDKSQGFFESPKTGSLPVIPDANSFRLFVPIRIAPFLFKIFTIEAVVLET